MILMYLKAFLVGGLLCGAGEFLVLRTRLTPARILVGYILAGVLLSALGLYAPLVDFAGAGATVPLTGFGHALAQGVKHAVQESGLLDETGGISPLALFGNNLQATLTAAAMGFVPFVFLPVFSLVLNSVIIGAVLSLAGSLHMGGITAGQMLLLGLLPHGIFEIPAITLGIAMGLYLCRQMNGTLRKRPGTPRIEAVLPHLCRVAIFGLLPLLAAAAVIETYLTPVLLGLAL